ncbi:MAG: DNA photolyase family protein [Hyphomicrobiales bacterium]|nr:DNA photolyase family protein [Hyphomicrobiales bacterium]
MSVRPAVIWFRDDLRLDDHPALDAVARDGRPVVALFVLDEVSPGLRPLGSASRWWLHRSLAALADDLGRLGVPLVLRRGPASIVVPALVAEIDAGLVAWNRRYGGGEMAIDRDLKATLRERGVEARSFQASLLFEPMALRTATGGPYRVFTPFWRAARAAPPPRPPLAAPTALRPRDAEAASDRLADWRLLPSGPDWSGGLAETWRPGEAGARDRLRRFLDTGIYSYSLDRDRPDLEAASRLSPHLRFGEISPFRIWAEVAAFAARPDAPIASIDKFLSEIGWREFSHHLLFHFPDLATRNFQARFDAFPWRDDPAFFDAWRTGRTGLPIVDAGLRQLWRTGWMHNRVRMIAASYLVKHGLVDWRDGERWFWDTLVDACPANNPAGWQWVAGSGADAAPYFRIFNPVTQGAKFDPDGVYVRRWVPEIAALPTRVLHAPWTADAATLASAGVRLGFDYPRPIVDHAFARARALDAFAATAAPH